MQASGARGSIGKASYEAVRKHIDEGKKATEAFKLVAQETGRSTATVQTAYYRVARSLPGGGGVQLRPRKKTAAKSAAAKTATTGKTPARRGRPPKSGAGAVGGGSLTADGAICVVARANGSDCASRLARASKLKSCNCLKTASPPLIGP